MSVSCPAKVRDWSHSRARRMDMEQNSEMFRSATRTARASGRRRAPSQAGQGRLWRKRDSSSRQMELTFSPSSSSGTTPRQPSSSKPKKSALRASAENPESGVSSVKPRLRPTRLRTSRCRARSRGFFQGITAPSASERPLLGASRSGSK